MLFIGDKTTNTKLRHYAKSFGLKNVTTIDELAEIFPHNDIITCIFLLYLNITSVVLFQKVTCFIERGKVSKLTEEKISAEQKKFDNPIEAIVVTSTPTNWERHMQLIIDVILGEGHPNRRVDSYR